MATGPVHLSVPIVLSMAALGMLSTGVAYIWNARIIVAWGATNAAAVTRLRAHNVDRWRLEKRRHLST